MRKDYFIEKHKKDIIAEPSGKSLYQLEMETLQKKKHMQQLLQLLLNDQH